MAASDRELIVTNLVTVLGGINGSSPYTTDVVLVEEEDRVESEIPAERTPWIGLIEGVSAYRSQPCRSFYVEFPIDLKLVTAGSTWAEARENLNDLYDDVVHALHLDPSRGGNAHETYMVSDSPVKRTAGDDHRASMVLSIVVRYIRSITVNA